MIVTRRILHAVVTCIILIYATRDRFACSRRDHAAAALLLFPSYLRKIRRVVYPIIMIKKIVVVIIIIVWTRARDVDTASHVVQPITSHAPASCTCSYISCSDSHYAVVRIGAVSVRVIFHAIHIGTTTTMTHCIRCSCSIYTVASVTGDIFLFANANCTRTTAAY